MISIPVVAALPAIKTLKTQENVCKNNCNTNIINTTTTSTTVHSKP